MGSWFLTKVPRWCQGGNVGHFADSVVTSRWSCGRQGLWIPPSHCIQQFTNCKAVRSLEENGQDNFLDFGVRRLLRTWRTLITKWVSFACIAQEEDTLPGYKKGHRIGTDISEEILNGQDTQRPPQLSAEVHTDPQMPPHTPWNGWNFWSLAVRILARIQTTATLQTAGENKKWCSHFGAFFAVTCLPCNLTVPILRGHPGAMMTCPQRRCMDVHSHSSCSIPNGT